VAGLPLKIVDNDTLEALKRYRWPGNVRELENMVQRFAALYSQEIIGLNVVRQELEDKEYSASTEAEGQRLETTIERQLTDYFADQRNGVPPAGLYDRVLQKVEKPLITMTLRATRGNQVKAAEVLGLNRNTLRKKIRKLDIPVIRGGR